MSIEYTIDIQLTELGFPDILQAEESSETQSSCCPPTSTDSLSSNVKSLSTARKQGLQINQDGKEVGVARHTSNTTDESRPPPPALGVKLNTAQDEEDVGTTRVDEHATGNKTTDGQQEPVGSDIAVEECAKFQEGEHNDDSDDSQVSYVYEEDSDDDEEEEDDNNNEEEKDDDEEEGVSSALSHSRNYHCSICDIQLSSKLQFNDHMNLHSGARPYICAECGKRFCQVNSYRAHLRTHAKAKTERHQCRICLKNYPSEEGLKFHLSVNHFETQFFECDLCKRLFPSLSECEKHVQVHKRIRGLSCRVCRRRFFSRKSLLRHRKKRCSASFRCTDCQLVFPKKNALLKHSFSHLGLLPYTCIRCQRHFRLAKLYHQHKCEPNRIHCVACLREFPKQEDFEQHKKDTGCWGNQEPNAKADEIRCLECGEKFDSTDELKKHAGAHQRVLKCAECGKGFRSALLLMSHMGGHAGKSPCLCQTCGLGFPHQQNYDSHLKTCGQTPPPESTFRKRHASKSPLPATKKLSAESQFSKASESKKHDASLPETIKFNAQSESSNVQSTNTVTTPAAVLKRTASASSRLAPLFPAPLKSPGGLSYATNEVSGGQPSTDGLWKLTVDKPPPPGLNLVVFLPVGPLQTTEVPLASGIPKALALPAMQALSQAPLSAVPANSHLGVNAAFSGPLNNPLDVSPSNNDKYPDAPLDLSQKSRQECLPVFKKEQDEVKQGKVEPMVIFTPVVKTESSTPVMQIKQEPQNPGSHASNEPVDWVPEKKIKMERDL